MAKKSPSFDLALPDPKPGVPLFDWLYEGIRTAILDGRLRRGVRLPASRDASRLYGVSRGTVVRVFEQLASEGYVVGKVGLGTTVNTLLPEDLLHAPKAALAPPSRRTTLPRLSFYGRSQTHVSNYLLQPLARAFRPAVPALDQFPLHLWARIAARRMRRASYALLAYGDPHGYLPLRQAVADYLGSARGVRCSYEQVIVLAGIQHGLDLTARLLLNPGDPVWVEDPCFFGIPAMLKAAGARVISVPVDHAGLEVDSGRRLEEPAKLVYVTPAHQFPLGHTMTADRRIALLNWARSTGALIFEDDYDSEYRYSGRPIPALQGMGADSVIFAGSFSKVLFPALRLGYVVVPPSLAETFAAARFTMDGHSPVLDQAILCDFITEGHFGRHIRRMRELYAERLQVLREAVQQKAAGLIDLAPTATGVHAIGWLATGLDADAVAHAAIHRNVEALPVSRFTTKIGLPHGIVLGFGGVGEREIRRGMDELVAAIEQTRRPRKRASKDVA